MRWVVSVLCVVGALLLIAASMVMNFTYWSGQGADAQSAHTLGAVSIGIDIFKGTLPLIIGWALRERLRRAAGIATVFMCGCVVFSFVSALGFAATSRGAVTANHEASSARLAGLNSELQTLQTGIAKLNAPRPKSVIDEAIAKAKQDRRWDSSKQCTDPTVEPSRSFCKDFGDLKIELASAIEADALSKRLQAVQTEINQLTVAGARQVKDIQAGLLARITGQGIDSVQTALVLLVAIVVEFGAAFGLFLAVLPFQRRDHRGSNNGSTIMLPLKPTAVHAVRRLQGPTKFVRGPDGGLMIE